jgi:hypothetical protein
MAVGAVRSELVSKPMFPVPRQFTGNFIGTELLNRPTKCLNGHFSPEMPVIPWARNSEAFESRQGTEFDGSSN